MAESWAISGAGASDRGDLWGGASGEGREDSLHPMKSLRSSVRKSGQNAERGFFYGFTEAFWKRARKV